MMIHLDHWKAEINNIFLHDFREINSSCFKQCTKSYKFLALCISIYVPELDYLEQTRQIELLEVYETMQTKTDLNWVLVWVWPKGKQADSLNHLWQQPMGSEKISAPPIQTEKSSSCRYIVLYQKKYGRKFCFYIINFREISTSENVCLLNDYFTEICFKSIRIKNVSVKSVHKHSYISTCT